MDPSMDQRISGGSSRETLSQTLTDPAVRQSETQPPQQQEKKTTPRGGILSIVSSSHLGLSLRFLLLNVV